MRYSDRKKPEKQNPGPMQVVLDFLRTADGERDTLGDAAALKDWLVEKKLLPPDAPLSEDDHREALTVRAGFHALAVGNGDEEADSEAVQALNDALGTVSYTIRFKALSSRRTLNGSGWTRVKARFADLVHSAMEAGRWKRVKVCPGCGRHFYDRSTNFSGKWCPGKRCSSRATSKAFRDRHPRIHGRYTAPPKKAWSEREETRQFREAAEAQVREAIDSFQASVTDKPET